MPIFVQRLGKERNYMHMPSKKKKEEKLIMDFGE